MNGVKATMRSSRLFFIALGAALSALLMSPVAAAEEPEVETGAEIEPSSDAEDWEFVSAGTFGRDTERTPAVVLGVKTERPGHDPEMIGVFLFSRRALSEQQPRPRPPVRIAPARQNGVWVLVVEGRF